MKKDFTLQETRFPFVFCKSIVERYDGLFITFVDLITNKEYEHFQVMPGSIDTGKTKAETYLRRLARAADLDKDYLILDFTSNIHLRDVKPIIGRVFRLKVNIKKALPGSGYEKTCKRIYYSAEEIIHFEGDGEFCVDTAMYAFKQANNPNREVMLDRLVTARSGFAEIAKTMTHEEQVEFWKEKYSL